MHKARLLLPAALIPACLLAWCVVASYSPPQGAPILAPNTASLDSRSYTFKCQPVINEDQPDFTLTVPVVNQTGRTVEFQHITTSCGCSKSTLDAYALRPGDRTTMRICLNLHGRSGMQRISAVLEEKSGAAWRYAIEVPIFPRARMSQASEPLSVPRCQPQSLLDGSATIELFADRRSALPELTGFRVSDSSCKVDQLPAEDVQVAANIWVRRVPVRFSLTAPAKPGAFCTTVTASYRYNDAQRDCSLDISGVVLSLFEVSPLLRLFQPRGQRQAAVAEGNNQANRWRTDCPSSTAQRRKR